MEGLKPCLAENKLLRLLIISHSSLNWILKLKFKYCFKDDGTTFRELGRETAWILIALLAWVRILMIKLVNIIDYDPFGGCIVLGSISGGASPSSTAITTVGKKVPLSAAVGDNKI